MAEADCDVLVIGSGAGGLAAAVAAAARGLKVIVAEKAAQVGGTTAWSGGFLWVPNNPVSLRDGVRDSAEAARTYLRHEAANHFDAACVDAFLDAGPQAVDFFERETALQFDAASAFSDYHPDAPGGTAGGRSIVARPFEAKRLGAELRRLRAPLPELTFAGLMIGSGPELKHFFNVTRSLRSVAYVAGRLAAHARDLALNGRGMRLTNGNALAGRLFRSALDRGVQVLTEAGAQSLLREAGRVVGATLAGGRELRAGRGVVLAAGGFPHDVARRRAMFPHDPDGAAHLSPAPPENSGDGLRLGEAVGAAVQEGYPNAAAWVPVSRVPRKSKGKEGGGSGVFPHFIDRAKPGLIAVRADGRRFVNEANSYHDFVQALVAATPAGAPVRAWLVVDHPFVRRFGLGFVKPFPVPLGGQLRSGYLKRGATLAALAATLGVDATALAETVARHNRDALAGADSAFGKGSTAYNRFNGDPETKPNPCLAPIATAPFYAVEVVVGDLGTFAGLRANADAQVLDGAGQPIPGLYAAGNDMASIMGGNYPGGGITLGPAVTFGWIAARHLASAAA